MVDRLFYNAFGSLSRNRLLITFLKNYILAYFAFLILGTNELHLIFGLVKYPSRNDSNANYHKSRFENLITSTTDKRFSTFFMNSSTIMASLSTSVSNIEFSNLSSNNTSPSFFGNMPPETLFKDRSRIIPSTLNLTSNEERKHEVSKFGVDEKKHNSQKIDKNIRNNEHQNNMSNENYWPRWNYSKRKNAWYCVNCRNDFNDGSSKENLLKLLQDYRLKKTTVNNNTRNANQNNSTTFAKKSTTWTNYTRFTHTTHGKNFKSVRNVTNDRYWTRKTNDTDQYGYTFNCTSNGSVSTQKKIHTNNSMVTFDGWQRAFANFSNVLMIKENNEISNCHKFTLLLKYITKALGYKCQKNTNLLAEQKLKISRTPYQSNILRNFYTKIRKNNWKRNILVNVHSNLHKKKHETTRKFTDRWHSFPVVLRCYFVDTVEFCKKISKIQRFYYFADRKILGRKKLTSTCLSFYKNSSYVVLKSMSYPSDPLFPNISKKLTCIISKFYKRVPISLKLKKNADCCSSEIVAESMNVRVPCNYSETKFCSQLKNVSDIPKLNRFGFYKIHINKSMRALPTLILLLNSTFSNSTDSNATVQQPDILSLVSKNNFDTLKLRSDLKTADFVKVNGINSNITSILVPVFFFFHLTLQKNMTLVKDAGQASVSNFAFYKKHDSLIFPDSYKMSYLFKQEKLLFIKNSKQNSNSTNTGRNTTEYFHDDVNDNRETILKKKKLTAINKRNRTSVFVTNRKTMKYTKTYILKNAARIKLT
ncbi:uncharacterized protein LOC128882633 [Hylaeus volcanicus]|uniref:uncharacterized protein LOC128882633 n=1 Tax=Hylaeus volcanicus TaxID=313075 RepID=UPI0023B82E04|nr:uncharacterized protein LOC128882633 [Hylaeus volcanicus]